MWSITLVFTMYLGLTAGVWDNPYNNEEDEKVTTTASYGRQQHMVVEGQFFCPSDPEKAKNVKIAMIDRDTGRDDHLADTETDGRGKFKIRGDHSEISKLNIRLHIYHNCKDKYRADVAGATGCGRKWTFKMPDKYVRSKGDPNPFWDKMDLGRINLEIIMNHEGVDCFQWKKEVKELAND